MGNRKQMANDEQTLTAERNDDCIMGVVCTRELFSAQLEAAAAV